MNDKKGGSYRVVRNVIFFLDSFLACLIIFFSQYLLSTTFGKATLTFGLIMIAVTTILRIFQQW